MAADPVGTLADRETAGGVPGLLPEMLARGAFLGLLDMEHLPAWVNLGRWECLFRPTVIVLTDVAVLRPGTWVLSYMCSYKFARGEWERGQDLLIVG